MSFMKYETYKDSGVEWFNLVPSHWEIQPCRSVFVERTEKNEPQICGDYLSLMANIGVIPYEEKGDVGNKKPEDLGKCKQVFPGDLVINSMNYGIGSYGLSTYRGVCSPVYIVLTPKQEKIEERFAFRILETKQFQKYAQSFGNGILEHRAAINWDILKVIGIPIPPIDEQRKILVFLDTQVAQIDLLVTEQEKLIGLLTEKRQAVISRAVTKGIQRNVRLKNSEDSWLGDIPEHWDRIALKWISRRFSGGTPDKTKIEYWTEGTIPWLNSGAVNDRYIITPSALITEDAFNSSSAKWIPKDALVMALAGQGRTKGMVAQLGIPTTSNQSMAAIVLEEGVDSRFIYWWLESNYENIRNLGGGDLRDGLNLEMLGNISCPIPPLEEQAMISRYLDKETTHFDKLCSEARNTISLLQERRSALVSLAVTGQIDVRNAKAAENYA